MNPTLQVILTSCVDYIAAFTSLPDGIDAMTRRYLDGAAFSNHGLAEELGALPTYQSVVDALAEAEA